MLKIAPIPFGNDNLDAFEPVRIEADFRNRTIQVWLGGAVEDQKGICLGVLDCTSEKPQMHEFPVLDKQIVLQDPAHFDPATADLFEHLRAALEPFLNQFYLRAAIDLAKESFRIGRIAVPLVLTWQDRDPEQHRQYLEKIEPAKEEQ